MVEPSVEHHSLVWRHRKAVAGAIVAVIAISTVVAVLVWQSLESTGPGPSAFGPGAISSASPGSVGCRAIAGDLCFAVTVQTSLSGVPASNLFFAVSNQSPISYPVENSIPLGPGASVSLLNGSVIAGVWNFTLGTWSTVPVGLLPTTIPFEVVLDTGLTSSSTLTGSYFYVQHSDPYGGATGVPLG